MIQIGISLAGQSDFRFKHTQKFILLIIFRPMKCTLKCMKIQAIWQGQFAFDRKMYVIRNTGTTIQNIFGPIGTFAFSALYNCDINRSRNHKPIINLTSNIQKFIWHFQSSHFLSPFNFQISAIWNDRFIQMDLESDKGKCCFIF